MGMLVSLRDITLLAHGTPAFEHTDWLIQKGEHWAVIGPTGAGKTLLAGAINRRVAMLGGEVRFFFDETCGPAGRTYLRPGEVLTLSGETHRSFLSRYAGYHQARWQSLEGDGVPRVRDFFGGLLGEILPGWEDLIESLGLVPLLDRKVLHLSHGESRKVHFIFLLLQRPKLLILDDPLAGLDAASRVTLARAIEELLRGEVPQLLFISSRRDEIPAGVDRVLLVDRMHVRAQGTRDTVLAQFGLELMPASELAGMGVSTSAFDLAVAQYDAALGRGSGATSEIVRMEGIAVNYGEVQVLRDVTWRVQRGERWLLSGPNGAGKSTLLSLILADNPQGYANELYLFGRRRGSGESIWEIKQNIGWVSPELHIHYPLSASCFEVVSSGFFDSVGLYRGCTPTQREAAEAWLEAFGLREVATAPFHSLSSGQQRLALLARALVKESPMLVLDEPCQGLDAAHRDSFLHLLDQICMRTAVTLIYVTHDPNELPASITHRLRLERGTVAEASAFPHPEQRS